VLTAAAAIGGVGCGALACAILVANNLRDIPTDRAAGKRTLAVVLGDRRTRGCYVALLLVAYGAALLTSAVATRWALLALLSAPLARTPLQVIRAGGQGRDLIRVLAGTSRLHLGYGALLGAGLAWSSWSSGAP
jgi:1,4-dihydroxy-2-naphthoate octaprenyltransferase